MCGHKLNRNIVIVGAGGHSGVIIDIIERQGEFNIIGLIDSSKDVGTKLMGYEIIGREDRVPELVGNGTIIGGIVAIGHNWARHRMVKVIQDLAPGFSFVNAIHPSARIAREVALGDGLAIMAGVSVNPGSRIGDHCVLNTNASVDHDNVLEEFSCLQPNAATGGNVKVGAYSVIAIGANVIHGIAIGSHTVIGAGSTVVSDMPVSVVAFGSPCRIVRSRQPTDNYY